MKKLLIIIFLLIICAALEMPEDYQWDYNTAQEMALAKRNGRYIPSQTPVKVSMTNSTSEL